MPELPEVEIVKEGLRKLIEPPTKIKEVRFRRRDLRSPLPLAYQKHLQGQSIQTLERRAKYILLKTEDFQVVSHLGMTGSWRLLSENNPLGLHDHILIELSNDRTLVYRDPRRFGVFDVYPHAKASQDRRLTILGPEPLDKKLFTGDHMWQLARGKTAPIKNFIMDQKVVVGVGNIYAVEALFQAGISPLVQAQKVSRERYSQLASEIVKVLKKAIKQGGSTIRDFTAADGHEGAFQQSFFVYGRDGEACRRCGTVIRQKFLSGRNSFWCVKCQR